ISAAEGHRANYRSRTNKRQIIVHPLRILIAQKQRLKTESAVALAQETSAHLVCPAIAMHLHSVLCHITEYTLRLVRSRVVAGGFHSPALRADPSQFLGFATSFGWDVLEHGVTTNADDGRFFLRRCRAPLCRSSLHGTMVE
ncbi:MAG: hypothetical protein ABR589_04965, partial [Chthoniobacterales bacterium]